MDATLGFSLAQAARLIRRTFDERARSVGVTRPQWQVLSVLRHNEGIKQGGLADLLEVEPITAGRMIDRMQEAQLVERRADPNDRRAWRLFLTERGRETIESLRPCVDETYAIALVGVSPEELASLIATLGKIRANLVRKVPVEADS